MGEKTFDQVTGSPKKLELSESQKMLESADSSESLKKTELEPTKVPSSKSSTFKYSPPKQVFILLSIVLAILLIILLITFTAVDVAAGALYNKQIKDFKEETIASFNAKFQNFQDEVTEKAEILSEEIRTNFTILRRDLLRQNCSLDSLADRIGRLEALELISQQNFRVHVNRSLQFMSESSSTAAETRTLLDQVQLETQDNKINVQQVNDSLQDLNIFTSTSIQHLEEEQMELAMETYRNISQSNNYLEDRLTSLVQETQVLNSSLQELTNFTDTSIQYLEEEQIELTMETSRSISQLDDRLDNLVQETQVQNNSLRELTNFTSTSIQRLKAEQIELAMVTIRNISLLTSQVRVMEERLTSLIQNTRVTLTESLTDVNANLTSLKGRVTQLAADSRNSISMLQTTHTSFTQELGNLEYSLNQASHTLSASIDELNRGLQEERQHTNSEVTQLRGYVNQLHSGTQPFRSAYWIITLGLTLACVLLLS